MPLLLDSDYEDLSNAGLKVEEDEAQRFLVFIGVKVDTCQYTVSECDVLVIVPPNYPQAGNDMFWTSLPLRRKNELPVIQMMESGGSDNRTWKGREFCRWSRHWQPTLPGAWRPGKDGVMSIYRRIEWALMHPDCA